MGVYDISIAGLNGSPDLLAGRKGDLTLVVNVASRCGLTPQYTGLQSLHDCFAAQGFSVIGVPCNQFGGQEPGSPAEIAAFCATMFQVTFPLTEKVEVNGPGQHPLFTTLTAAADGSGRAGDVDWNFEKFLVDRDGAVVARFRPGTEPQADEIVSAVEAGLSATKA
ncbi:glutathione peroxidase [Micromonospora sp. NPDC049240]|uniref:glutathione peroxidase n=1 Tax=Micromonospora sp. NPDC049240 TaxID=3155151 RepID=UPI0034033E4E